MVDEEWRDIEGYEGLYQVSNLGRVKRLPRVNRVMNNGTLCDTKVSCKNLSDNKEKSGYVRYILTKDKIKGYFLGHRLVAQAFIPNPENKPEVNHIDGIKDNNNVKNLEWVTSKENKAHAIVNSLWKNSGEDNSSSKLKLEEIYDIIRLSEEGKMSLREIGKIYGVGRSTIGYVIKDNTWGVDGVDRVSVSIKLTPIDVILIRCLIKTGNFSNKEIGSLFGVSKTCVWNIDNNRTWKNIKID